MPKKEFALWCIAYTIETGDSIAVKTENLQIAHHVAEKNKTKSDVKEAFYQILLMGETQIKIISIEKVKFKNYTIQILEK